MVNSCCAYGCTEKASKDSQVSFHSFPKDEERRKLWVSKLRRENFSISKHSKICSKHFTSDSFDREKFGGTWLKKTAVPILFDFPEHLQVQRKERNPSKKKNTQDVTELHSEPGPSRKKRKYFIGDFQDKDMASPTKACHLLTMAKTINEKKRHTIKNLSRKTRRLEKRVCSLKEILTEMKKKALISSSASDVLEVSLPGPAAELLQRVRKKQTSTTKYSPKLRCFALTLQFYSPKAYKYVRKMFNTCLPHPSTIKKWYRAIDGSSAGFNHAALNALKIKAGEAAKKKMPVPVCGLIIDEMSVRNHVEWDGRKWVGYVDYGTDLDSFDLPKARMALVFMLNCLNGSWKIPFGYFFIDGLNAEERANLIKNSLEFVSDSGVEVVSLTFDGTNVNQSTAKELGANLEVASLSPSFPHPVTKKDIFILLDPSHMIKLVRNTLGSNKTIWHPNNGFIDWGFIVKLEKLQNEQKLFAGTKLRRAHIEWYREKMKVRLAAQTFSNSVADALLYLEKDLKHPDFKGAEATAKFVRMFNNIFDLLNSRNLLGKGYKRPLSQTTEIEFSLFMEEAERYIEELKIAPDEAAIIESNRKTGFLGFLICLHSVSSLYKNLTKGPKSPMSFLMTYKMSQDHLEMFFSAIRSKGGYNNNPTCKQFQAAYVRLLCHVEIISGGNENCIALDSSTILNISSAVNVYKRAINDDVQLDDEDDTQNSDLKIFLNSYICDVSSYIGGFIVRKLHKTLKCPQCAAVIKSENLPSIQSLDSPMDLSLDKRRFESKLTRRKDRGGLIYPSEDVIKICHFAEKEIRLRQASGKLVVKNLMSRLILATLQEINSTSSKGFFTKLNEHIQEQNPIDNHKILLMKSILFSYFKIRLCHIGKVETQELQRNKCRSINTKTTIFKGQ